MERGNITKWLVKEGDEIRPGVVLAEIETDKVRSPPWMLEGHSSPFV